MNASAIKLIEVKCDKCRWTIVSNNRNVLGEDAFQSTIGLWEGKAETKEEEWSGEG
jgi:hypothetical protein